MTTSGAPKPTCFIAMPMTTHPDEAERYGDDEHWLHVMRTIFVPAIEAAGFDPIEPTAQGSDMIRGRIIEQLSNADMVLCDLSSHNPNVFFELGVRTSLNKPIALVKDELTSIPFDTNGLNTHAYASTMRGWEVSEQVTAISKHLAAAAVSCAGENPMWRRFGLTISAEKPAQNESATDARLELILDELQDLRVAASSRNSRNASVGMESLSESDQLLHRIAMRLQADSWSVTNRSGDLIASFHRAETSPQGREAIKIVQEIMDEAGWIAGPVSTKGRELAVTLRQRPKDRKAAMG